MVGSLPGLGASDESVGYGRCGRYVGRVGALAVALGVGFAVTTGQGLGLARADDSAANDDTGAVDSPAGEPAPGGPVEQLGGPVEQPGVPPGSPPPVGGVSGAPAGAVGAAPAPGASPGEMKVSASGSVNTSVNDAGQFTDTEDGELDGNLDEKDGAQDAEGKAAALELNPAPVVPIVPVLLPIVPVVPVVVPPPPVAPVGGVPPIVEGAVAQKDSPVQMFGFAPVGLKVSAVDRLDPVDSGPVSAAPEVFSTQRTAGHIEGLASRTNIAPTPPADVVSSLEAPASSPVSAGFTATIVNVASSMVALFLSPFVASGPAAPADPPLLWAVLSWVRREIHRTFFNHTPRAVADEVGTSEGVSTVIDVAGNDIDDGKVKVTGVTQPENGTAVLNADGTVTYTPNADFHGTDTFNYTISDASGRFHFHGLLGLLTGKGHTATGTVTVTVDPVNSGAPVANPDTAEVDEGGSVVIAVLANDTDPDGASDIDAGSVEVTQPAHGSVTVNTDGTVTYQSNGDEVTSDSFTYTVRDEFGELSDTGTVSVTIVPVNDAPVAVDDTLEVNEGGVRSIRTFLNDTDAEGDSTIVGSSVEITQQPLHGTATLNPNGSITYRSTGGPASTDSLTYTVRDSSGAVSNTGTLHITINHAPVAVPDKVTTTQDTPITIDVLANDSDPDGDPVTILSTTINSTQGSVALGTTNVVYTPPPGQTGEFTFYYSVWDDSGFSGSDTAVTVIVLPANDGPVAVDDTADVNAGFSKVINILGNDTDPEGDAIDPATVTITQPANGVATVNANGTVTYRSTGPVTTDSFTYTVRDSEGAVSNTGTVTVNINRAPVARPDSVTTTRDTPVTINVLANDDDPDGDPVRIAATSINTTQGTLDATPTHVVYTPPPGQAGVFTFSYQVWDDVNFKGEYTTVTVTVIEPPV